MINPPKNRSTLPLISDLGAPMETFLGLREVA